MRSKILKSSTILTKRCLAYDAKYALTVLEPQLAASNADEVVLRRWVECRNGLSELKFHMQRFTEAKALYAGTAGAGLCAGVSIAAQDLLRTRL